MKERWRSVYSDISFFVISLLCKLVGFWLRVGQRVANGLYRSRARQKVYLPGYLALVLFAFIRLNASGCVFVLVELVCWRCAFFGCFCYYYNNSTYAECLRTVIKQSYVGEEKARALYPV